MAKKKPARKPATKKKATKKKATKKKATKKKATKKKATKKKATRKKATARKATKKKATRKKAAKRSGPQAIGEILEPSIEDLRARHAREKADAEKAAYDRHRERARSRQAEKSKSGREIGPLPGPLDMDRRESCRSDVELFALTYFPNLFKLKSGDAHKRVWAQIQAAVLDGGLFAMAMPRASGKTTMCIVAIIWATVYGHRRYSVLVGSTQSKAEKLMKILKRFLSMPAGPFTDDFPEVCLPCAELENKGNRCNGQLCDGQQTRIEWTADQIVLPTVTVDGQTSECAGAIIATAGLLGEIRGMLYVDADGSLMRPTFVLLDDPQTKKSASSLTETQFRLEVVDEDILGLVGPDQTLAVVMPCTVIAPDDLADQLLDPERNPDWQSERIPMLLSIPGSEAMDLWDEYRDLLIEARQTRSYAHANAFYVEHRKTLDDCEHYWPHRIPDDYKGISAIQFAMDWFLTRPKSFWSECQQNPLGDEDPQADLLSVEEGARKQHTQAAGIVPLDADILTAFIDVQHSLLYWCVIAFNSKTFSAYVVAYGAWPEQKTRNFQFRQARRKLADVYKGQRGGKLGVENVVRRGLVDCLDYLLGIDRTNEEGEVQQAGMAFTNEDGVTMQVQRLGVDCSDGKLADDLRDTIGRYKSPRVFAAMGRDDPLAGKKQPGEAKGDRWRVRTNSRFKIRQLVYQPNHWKSFFHARLSTDLGEAGSLSLFQDKPFRHQTFAEHCRSETRKISDVRGEDGTLETRAIWKLPPSKPDNHWFDTAVGCCVLAAHEDCQLWSRPSGDRQPAVSLSELRKQRRAG